MGTLASENQCERREFTSSIKRLQRRILLSGAPNPASSSGDRADSKKSMSVACLSPRAMKLLNAGSLELALFVLMRRTPDCFTLPLTWNLLR